MSHGFSWSCDSRNDKKDSSLGHLFPVTINKVKNKLTRDLFKLL